MARAAAPMIHWIHPRTVRGLSIRSALPRIQRAPRARPRMKAESMISKEWVAVPRTRESIRIQAIS